MIELNVTLTLGVFVVVVRSMRSQRKMKKKTNPVGVKRKPLDMGLSSCPAPRTMNKSTQTALPVSVS